MPGTGQSELFLANLRHLQHLMMSHPGNHRSQGLHHQYPAEGWWFHSYKRRFASKNVSLVNKI